MLSSESSYSLEDRLVPVEGGEVKVRIVVPATENKDKTFPVIVWYHGGGVYLCRPPSMMGN